MIKINSLLKDAKGELSTIIMLVILCVIFGINSEYFFTLRNIMNIGTYASIMGTMAAGLTVAMLLGGLDVSQYSLAAMAGMIMGIMIEQNIPVGVTIPVTILVGVFGGCINAFIITVMRVNPIIATMGTQFVFRGAAFLLTNGRYIRITNPVYYFIGNGRPFGIPFCLFIMLLTYAIVWYLLKYTKYGRQVYAVGGNIQVAKLAGINANYVKFVSHILAGITAVMGGIITVCQTSSAMPNHGYGNDMDGIAAVILGGIGLAGGKGKVFGTLTGILVLAVLVNGMTLLNVQSYWQQVVKGIVLISAVFIDALRNGKSMR
jgi:ribose transport system permease protein